MSTHSNRAARLLREVMAGNGGAAIAVTGDNGPFHAGVHRQPASGLLEAVLSFVHDTTVYENIVLFTNVNLHGESIYVGGDDISVTPAIWALREPSHGNPPQSNTDSQLEEDDTDWSQFTGTLAPPADHGRLIMPLQNESSWPLLLNKVLGQIDEALGREWRGASYFKKEQAAGRTLLVLDAKLLRADDAEQFQSVLQAPKSVRAKLVSRLESIPHAAKEAGVDVVVLASRHEAESLNKGTFIHDQILETWGESRMPGAQDALGRYTQLPQVGWACPWEPMAEAPAEQPHSAIFSKPTGGLSLYNALRTVPLKPQPSVLEEIERDIVGLDSVKEQLRDILLHAKDRARRIAEGIPVTEEPLHAAFYGSPGTGKTMTARLVGRMYAESGLLSGGKFTEVTGSQMIAGYSGQTGDKIRGLFREARGGVLFIDETYDLHAGERSGGDFAATAQTELLKVMEEWHGELAVILAGYKDKMDDFFANNNPGLKGRVRFHIDFPDYTDDELAEICSRIADARFFKLADGCREKMCKRFAQLRQESATKNLQFANGRLARTLLENAKLILLRRANADPATDPYTLIPSDFSKAALA